MYAIAFSGGKDSMACLYLMREQIDFAVYVDTGCTYPETHALIEQAANIVPMHIVYSDRKSQNMREGIPSDVVPINWTSLGQTVTGEKSCKVQGYLGCCYENIMQPLFEKMLELGATHMIYGQRDDESHRAPIRNGDVIAGITRVHPIENWTSEMVLEYLANFMKIPDHYAFSHSSLDCYDCTAYKDQSKDRVTWTREKHPKFYAEYARRKDILDAALSEALNG